MSLSFLLSLSISCYLSHFLHLTLYLMGRSNDRVELAFRRPHTQFSPVCSYIALFPRWVWLMCVSVSVWWNCILLGIFSLLPSGLCFGHLQWLMLCFGLCSLVFPDLSMPFIDILYIDGIEEKKKCVAQCNICTHASAHTHPHTP